MGKTFQTVDLATPVEKVWGTLRNFHDFSWGSTVIQSCEPQGDKPYDQVGARRLLNGAFLETLLELDDGKRILRYSIDDGPSPVSKNDIKNYVGLVQVKPYPDGEGSRVEWSSTWEGNDEPAYEFCHSIYVALLDSLKNYLD